MSYAFPDPAAQEPFEKGLPLPEAPRKEGFPPGDGAQVVPHFQTFAQIVNYVSRVYRWTHDEALRDNHTNALAIRRDPVIMDALRSRQLPTAQLPWHLECEDDEDQRQVEGVDALTDIVSAIPRFQMLKMHLLEALWFGRYGTQLSLSWKFKRGQKFVQVRDFKPINGDKLCFRFSGQPGVLVHALYEGTWEQTDRGRAHFFTPEEREQLIIHRHEPEDADFFEPELGGSLQGVGIRGRLYWLWFLRSQVTAFLMDYLERVGAGGFTIYYYEAGSQSSLTEVRQAAETQWRNNTILFPRYRDRTTGGPGVERIEASIAGAQLMQSLVTQYFDSVMRRYILGQNLTTEAASTGLGSGLADLHGETFARYIKYDAVNLADTLTSDLIAVLQKYSPYADCPPFRFVFDVDKPNAAETLEAAKTFWDMGGDIDQDQLRSIVGLEKPQPGHAMLAKMGAMSPAAAGSVPMGEAMMGQPGPMATAGDQVPSGQDGPQQMAKRGPRLRFSKRDFRRAVRTAFPGAVFRGGENDESEAEIDVGDKRISLAYDPKSNTVMMEFRFPGRFGRGAYKPNKSLQPGGVNFAKQLLSLVQSFRSRGLAIDFDADSHHKRVYDRLLPTAGYVKDRDAWESEFTYSRWVPRPVTASREPDPEADRLSDGPESELPAPSIPTVPAGKGPLKYAASLTKTLKADPGVLAHANTYLESRGLPPHAQEASYLPVNEGRARQIASLYDRLAHAPNDSRVLAAYRAFRREIAAQYDHLISRGVRFEPWQAEGQPYANSREMVEDARGGHLHFYTGGDFSADHLLSRASGRTAGGRSLTYNDLFRAVHDYYGHALYGNQFGPRGEEHAYRTHARMFSPEARPAMAAETRGQNSWVNFGPHGEANRKDPANTVYAEQKNVLLPEHFLGD